MSKIVYLNSKFIKFREAKVHIEDRGLQFSDSVYEVICFYNKKSSISTTQDFSIEKKAIIFTIDHFLPPR